MLDRLVEAQGGGRELALLLKGPPDAEIGLGRPGRARDGLS